MEAEATTEDNCRRLVDNHVYSNVSYLVQELSKQEQYMDDLMEVQVNYAKAEEHDSHLEEALEHWIISEWLAKRLLEEGEMVIEFLGLTIWGRTTSGQAICIDLVIEDIYSKHWA
tara:strand:+ start:1196 stop:1540 length:345 start_codon:yes stop_codon:yes gene_type:complete